MYRMALIILGGVGVGVALSVSYMWPLAIISLLPLLYAVYAQISVRRLFLSGWLFGVSLMGSTLYWFFNTLPLTWLGITNPFLSVLVVFVFWFVLVLVLGVAVGCWAIAARYVRTHPLVDIVSFSILWVLFEYLRMWLYTAVTYGSGSVLEPFFSFGFVGYALAHNHYMLQLAAIGGVFALSFTVVVLAMSMRLIGTVSQKYALAAFVILVALSFIPAQLQHPDAGVYGVEPIETNIPSRLVQTQEDLASTHAYITEKIRQVAENNPNVSVVVLPEFSNYTQQLDESSYQKFFIDIFGNREVLLIDSERVDAANGDAHSSIVFFSTTQGEQSRSYKRFFLPAGEYMPYLGALLLSAFGLEHELLALQAHRSYTPELHTESFTHNETTYTALTCSDAVSPLLYKQLGDTQTRLLVNTSSLAWFHHAQNPQVQFIAMAKVHAVWNRSWYVQATNAGLSFFITPNGHVVH